MNKSGDRVDTVPMSTGDGIPRPTRLTCPFRSYLAAAAGRSYKASTVDAPFYLTTDIRDSNRHCLIRVPPPSDHFYVLHQITNPVREVYEPIAVFGVHRGYGNNDRMRLRLIKSYWKAGLGRLRTGVATGSATHSLISLYSLASGEFGPRIMTKQPRCSGPNA